MKLGKMYELEREETGVRNPGRKSGSSKGEYSSETVTESSNSGPEHA